MPESYARADFRPSPKIRWNGWWFVIAIIPIAVLEILARFFPVQIHDRNLAGAISVATNVVGYAWILLTVLLASRLRGLRSLKDDFGWSIRPVDMATGAGGAVVVVALALATAPVARALGISESNIRLAGDPLWDTIGVFVLPTVVAAPIEELLFRGLLMRWIRILLQRRTQASSTMSMHVSVLASSAVFAMVHLSEVRTLGGVIILAVQTFGLGAVTGYLATRTGRLGPAVVTHGLYNAIIGGLALSH